MQWYGDTARLLGLPPRRFSGRYQDYLKLLHPDDAASSRTVLRDTLKGRRPEYRTAERIIWPDGSIHWLETYGRADYGADGRAVRMMGVVKEITERKRQESARERAEKQLARVFDASPDYMVIVRANDGRFIAVNPAFERVTGYLSHEIVGRTVDDLKIWGIPGERERFVADLQKQGSIQNRPVLLRARDASLVAGKMSATLIEHEGEKLIISLMHDVSAVKQLERRARTSESKFAALFEHSPEAISLYRVSDGVRLEANAAWERMTGYSRTEVAGRPAQKASLFKDQQQRVALIARVESEGAMSNVDARLVRADRSEMDALLSAVRIEHEGEKCILWCWRDVTTERETARRASQSERKFQVLFETSPVGMIVTLPRERKVLEINEAAQRILGVSHEQAIGKQTAEAVRDIIDADELERLRDRALAGERGVTGSVRFVRHDGDLAEVLVSPTLVDLDGEPHLITSLLDVTEQRKVERERQEADARYRALFETSLDGMVIGTPDNAVLDANPAACSMTGYSREELIGRGVAGLFHPDDLAAKPLRRDLGQKWSVVERRLARKGGGDLEVEIVAGPMPDRKVLAIMRDVTERKKVERDLYESEARFRALTGLSADWYWEQDEHFRFVWQDGESARPEGNRPPRYIGLTRWEAHPDSQTQEQWAAHRAQLEAHRSFRDLEFARPSTDGVTRWVSVSGHPIFDKTGKFRGYRGVGRDITERKRNETLLMNIARGVSAEVGGAFFRSLAGHLARELGADFAFIGELEPGGGRMRTLALLADGAMVEQQPYAVEGSMSAMALREQRTVVYSRGVRERFPDNAEMRRQGVEAYVGTPLYGADGVALGVLAVGNRKAIERGQFWASMIEIFGARAAAEIERSRAEQLVWRTNLHLEQMVQERTAQLEQANRELESYSYSISHDLRQPLNAIGGFAELLREEVAGGLSPVARDFVAEIDSNATRMEQMIESLMQLSHAGRSSLNRSAVDARQVVASVLHDLSANGRIQADVRVGELPPVAGDPVLLRQVWVNLIGNALKYSGRSAAPRVEIAGKQLEGMVEYSVRDNGVGFDMQHAERLFGAFQRLPSSDGFTGTGIGLAIVERIVRRHGGSIRAESAPGQGATFRFTLPDNPLT